MLLYSSAALLQDYNAFWPLPSLIYLGAVVLHGAQSPKYGALSALYAATEPSLQGKGGRMFGPNPLNFFNTARRWPKALQTVFGRGDNQKRMWAAAMQVFREVQQGKLL